MYAMIYARTESWECDENLLKERISLCKIWAVMNGYTVTAVFQDQGQAGDTIDRPGFTALCESVLKPNPPAIIVSTLTQLSDDSRDGWLIAEGFDEFKIEVYAIDEGRIGLRRFAKPKEVRPTPAVHAASIPNPLLWGARTYGACL